jgi:hypothetical protein
VLVSVELVWAHNVVETTHDAMRTRYDLFFISKG